MSRPVLPTTPRIERWLMAVMLVLLAVAVCWDVRR